MSTKGGILDVNNTKKGKAKGRFLEWGGTKGRGGWSCHSDNGGLIFLWTMVEQRAQSSDLSLECLINIDKVLFEEEIWRKNELLITHVECGKQKCEILLILNVEVNVKYKYTQII